MSNELIGYFMAIASMCIYGVYMSPKKFAGLSDVSFVFWMGCGIMLSAFLCYILIPGNGALNAHLIANSVLAGLIWASGNLTYTLSISRIELTRCTPIKNLSAPFGILLGMFLLSEGADKSLFKIICIYVSGVIILVGAWLLSRVGAVVKGRRLLSRKDYIIGCLLALWSAAAFSIYTVPMKLAFKAGMTPADYLFFMSAGMFCGMILPGLITKCRSMEDLKEQLCIKGLFKKRCLAVCSGIGLNLGQLMANYAVKLIGVSVVWPITKNSVAAVLFSAFVLKDVRWQDSKVYMVCGVVLCFVGIVVMGFGV